ncbi:MAG: zf-HC2 domain-containing protein [Acidobacteria bacterium]|nr:zf-HC2 domain-containing protein [Acidobacteriota bacterium]
MIPCKKIILELSNYLDNELDAGLRLELEEHMGRCPDCRVIIDTTRQTIQIYRGCEPYPLPPSLHDRLQQAVRAHYQQHRGGISQ